MSDHPRFFIEGIKRELRQYGGVGKLHHGAILLLLFDDVIKHTVIVMHLIGMREDVIQFNLAQFFTLIGLITVVVVDHRKVKDRGTITGLDQHRNVGDVRQQTVPFYYAHYDGLMTYYCQ